MCGIAGLVDRVREPAIKVRERLERMMSAIAHRGPDDFGTALLGFEEGMRANAHDFIAATRGGRVALGHRRLSILDLSEDGRQPMVSADGKCTITYNGEIYNYLELRAELEDTGPFRTTSDTEVLLRAYSVWGRAMLARLEGMFAFALWDAEREILFCARDPAGIKPFYFAETSERLVFASEPRAVLQGLGTNGSLDPARVAEFLLFAVSDYDDGTSYREVKQLQGGHWLEASNGRIVAMQRYFEPGQPTDTVGPDVPMALLARLRRSVDLHLRSDVSVGTCLSGGVDSATIVALAAERLGASRHSFQALTVMHPDPRLDESRAARDVAASAGVRWIGVAPPPRALRENVLDLVTVHGEPFGSLSIYAQFEVMRAASGAGLKVMLDGQGGDEVFVGYPRLALRGITDALARGRVGEALSEWRGIEKHASQSPLGSILSSVYFRSARLASLRAIARTKEFASKSILREARRESAEDMFAGDNLAQMQRKELFFYTLPRLLRYEDRNSMAHGIEARVPMLDRGLIEFGLALPTRWKVHDGWTKYALRRAVSGLVPDHILWATRKQGFDVPQALWLTALRPELPKLIDSPMVRDLFDVDAMIAAVDAGRGGDPTLFRCLSTALWISVCSVRA